MISNGYGDLKEKCFRIAHMGHVNAAMMLGTLGVVETGLGALGIPQAFDQTIPPQHYPSPFDWTFGIGTTIFRGNHIVAKAALNCRSSCRICKLTAGCVRLRRSAAAEKLPSSMTSTKVRRWSGLRPRMAKLFLCIS